MSHSCCNYYGFTVYMVVDGGHAQAHPLILYVSCIHGKYDHSCHGNNMKNRTQDKLHGDSVKGESL